MITETVLKEFKIVPNSANENERIIYRIVQWNKGGPMFEKRVQFKKDDEWRNGKAKGFTDEDMVWIGEHLDEIIEEMTKWRPRRKKKEKTNEKQN